MLESAVFLTGDRFTGFATQKQVSTVGSFLHALRAGSYDARVLDADRPAQLVPSA
jgi:hypothetical protein